MILVRDVFKLHFGRARDALALLHEGRQMLEQTASGRMRILTDLVGEYYTLVFEQEFASLAEFEQRLSQELGREEWRQWYGRFTPLVRSGYREVFRVVE